MEGFERKFEEQKIPEWYDLYFDYKYIKTLIQKTKTLILSKKPHLAQFFRKIKDCKKHPAFLK